MKSNTAKENAELRSIIKHIWPRTHEKLLNKVVPKPDCKCTIIMLRKLLYVTLSIIPMLSCTIAETLLNFAASMIDNKGQFLSNHRFRRGPPSIVRDIGN